MHEFGGYCFVDFSASAPYVAIDMHPAKDSQRLDAIFFSPHKFLGGPGSSGVVVFNRALYQNLIPDQPGGGTVVWTNPWGEHHFYDDIEVREDGGTPGFLQAIKGALAILLKEEMGISKMGEREHQLKERLLERLLKIPALQVLEPQQRQRLGFVSFYVRGLHHNLIVRLLNDKFGIQTRGGCSCAGTYGHILLHINQAQSKKITNQIDQGDLSQKPGWVRISLHPTMTDAEVEYIAEAVEEIVKHHHRWKDEYTFDPHTGDFRLLKASEFRLDLKQIFHE
jgi:selenocysteine lyase/cysteine desulfurase